MSRAALALILTSLAAPAAARPPVLSPPLDCQLGVDCYIPRYPDVDPGPGVMDYACGHLTGEGHSGTDFAVNSLAAMQRGVAVHAAAPGTVRAVRDGEEDRAKTPDDLPSIEGRECGNGVAITHGDGWETQYCHMKRGSIAVRPGDRVAKGSVLGQVGLSGQTSFPHVHITVRHDGEMVDPFAPNRSASCGAGPEDALWQDIPPYAPGGLIAAGFAAAIPEFDAVKAGTAGHDSLAAEGPALVVWGYAYMGRAGDVMRFTLAGPGGEAVLDEKVEIDRGQPAFFRAVGRRTPPGGWPAGDYDLVLRYSRDGKVLNERRAKASLR